jgi:hypothetical protein
LLARRDGAIAQSSELLAKHGVAVINYPAADLEDDLGYA